MAWSPPQIAERLRLDYPDDTTMRISHEATQQTLYVQGRGAPKRELTQCLRTGRALTATAAGILPSANRPTPERITSAARQDSQMSRRPVPLV